MNINLTSKERSMLEDQKKHEEVCIKKYSNYANQTSDPMLKALFESNGKIEQEHFNTINQLLQGQVQPISNQQSSGSGSNATQQQGQQSMQQQTYTAQATNNTSNAQSSDKDLCTDMLMTEKFVSGAYDTAIFEFKDTQVRDVLNHIQKEEQQHGEKIYNYMENNGMYNAQ